MPWRSLAGTLVLGMTLWTASMAGAQTSLNQTFSSTPTDWTFSSSSGGFTPTAGAKLNRWSNTRWLQLTNNTGNEANAAVYNGSFSAAGTSVYAQFNYQMYGGSGGTTNGGDGLTFFLYDASQPFSTGAYGGSLGYAQKTGINGMNGGYLGVGLDAYGNYSAASEGRVGGYNGTTQPVTESIAVRGPGQGQNGYAYLGGTGAQLDSGTNIDSGRNATTSNNTVQVLLSATNQLTVTLAKGGSTPQTVLQMDLSGYARPDLLSFGFTAGTGGATDYMFVNDLTVTTLTASKWTNSSGNGVWGLNTNWNPAVVPTSGSDILFDNSTATTAQVIDTGANRTIRSIAFDAPFDYTVNNNTLTLNDGNMPGFSGIAVTQTHGTGSDTINSNLSLQNAIEVQNGASGALVLNGAIANGGNTITFDGTGSGTVVNGAISGSGGVAKNDTGAVTLAGANTYTGGTTINSGTVYANNSTALGAAGAAVTLAGGTLGSTNGASINNTITLTGDAALANLTNNGTLTQSGANQVLNLANANQAGSVNLSDNWTSRTLTVQVDSGTSTIGGVIANGGGSSASSLTKTGSGTLVLAGANTYTGTTTISNGVLQLGASDRLADTGAVSIDTSGTLNLNGFSEKIGTLTALNGGATIDFGAKSGANTLVFGTYRAPSSGVLVVNNWESGSDDLGTTVGGQSVNTIYLSGYGAAVLDTGQTSLGAYGSAYLLRPGTQSTDTWQGSTSTWSTASNWSNRAAPTTSQIAVFGATGTTAVTLNTSTSLAGLQFAANAQSFTVTGTNTLTLNASVPYIQQKSANLETVSAGLSLAANSVMDVTGSGNLVLGGALSGTGNLVKDGTGAGKLILSGANGAYTGDIYVNNGILQAAGSSALGNAASTAVTVAQGATLELATNGTTANAMNVIGTGLNGAGALHNVSGSNTLSGTVTQSGDTTIAADAGTSLTLAGRLTGATATTTFAGAGNIVAAQIATSGSSGVNVNTTGTVTFNGTNANTYTGDTVVNSGTLTLAKSGGVTAVAGDLVVNAGTAALGASDQIATISSVTLNNAGTLNLAGYSNTIAQLGSTSHAAVVALGGGTLGINAVNNLNSTYAGSFTGGAGSNVQVTGTGKVYLTGDNSGYAGSFAVNGGTLNAGSTNTLGTGMVSVASGGNLQIQGGIGLANQATLSGTGTSGNGALENVGGTNTLSGAVGLSGSAAVQSDSGALNLNGAVSLGSNTLTVAGTGDTSIGGAVSGTGAVVKSGDGTLALGSTNTYSGGTTVNSGAVRVTANSGLGTGGVSVANGATVQLQGAISIGNAMSVSGAGALESNGSNSVTGAVTLTAASGTQSDAGTLALSGPVSLGGNDLTVAGAGNTMITGSISGRGGLTKADGGTATLAAANSYSGPTTVNAGTLAIAAANAIGAAGVTVNGGTLALNATNGVNASASLTISSGGTVAVGNSVSQTVAGLVTNATSTVNLGPNAVLTVNTSTASTLLGSVTGTGSLAYTGGGGLTIGNLNYGGTLSFTGGGRLSLGTNLNFGGTLVIGGTGTTTLSLGAYNLSVGTLHITGNTILDFGNSTATTLNATNLIIDSNVTVSVVNWVNMTNYFVAQNFVSQSGGTNTTAAQDQRGTTPVNQITFDSPTYTCNDTVWQSCDDQITPAPEPATYGALFTGAMLACFGWWSRRRRHAVQEPDALV